MLRPLVTLVGLAAVLLATCGDTSGGEKKRFGADVSEWSSLTPASATVFPVGGSGQVNGDFVVSERNGIQIGLRAQRRFSQNVDPLENERVNNVGVYLCEPGESDGMGRALWNYDIHVDLRDGFGVAKEKTLDDYFLILETDIGDELFGAPVPLEIVEDFVLPPNVVLFQTSLNPKFGNPPFDALAEGMYNFTLSLVPRTFNGAPITARMSVVVAE